jgi:hypothetical protein
MNIPSEIIAGDSDSWKDGAWTDTDGTLYQSTGYTLTYALRGPSAAVDLTATPDGTGWKTSLSTATSAGMTAGLWFWAAYITASGVRITAGQGELTVTANLQTATTGYDGRTQAEKALADAETALATFRSTAGRIKKYTIGSRTAEYETAAELLQVIQYWRGQVANEQNAKLIAQGLGNPRQMFVRFT